MVEVLSYQSGQITIRKIISLRRCVASVML